MTLDEIRSQYTKHWGDIPIGSVCLCIIDFVASTPTDELNFLTFNTFLKVTGKAAIDHEVIAALNLLTSSRLAIFDPHALLVDDDETEHELSVEQLAQAKQTGVLIHPETGEPVPDFESHLIPFFAPTDELFGELSNGR